MSEPQKKKRINLPKSFDETDRLKAARLVIDTILKRTENGRSFDGSKFKNYSEAYSKSLDFKIAGKSKNNPNLRLSGDMLDSLQILDNGPGFVTIGYNEGTVENDKATWAERSDNGPARKFLGVSDSELEQIIAEVNVDRPSSLSTLANEEAIQTQILSSANNQSFSQSLVDSILRSLQVDTSEN